MSNETIRRLRRVPFMDTLSTDALRLISFSGEIQILRVHEVLFEAGSISKGGYFVLQGTIAMEKNGQVMHRVEVESLIGELALITQTLNPMTAIALTASTLLHIPRSLFTRVLQEFPEDAAALHRNLADEASQLRSRLRLLGTHFSE